MDYSKNEFGVLQYPAGDARRLFVLLSAIDLLERPTLAAIADLTGLDAAAIEEDISRLQIQFGVEIHKIGTAYRIASWGDVLKKNGVKKRLKAKD